MAVEVEGFGMQGCGADGSDGGACGACGVMYSGVDIEWGRWL